MGGARRSRRGAWARPKSSAPPAPSCAAHTRPTSPGRTGCSTAAAIRARSSVTLETAVGRGTSRAELGDASIPVKRHNAVPSYDLKGNL